MSPTLSRAQLKDLAKNAGPDSPLHELVKATAPVGKPRTKAKDLPASQGRTLTFVLPMPESLTNSGKGKSRGFWAKVKAQKQYRRMLDERSRAGLLPRVPELGFGHVLVTSVMYLGRQMDVDNAMARHKWVLDWLQKAGYIVDDRYVKWTDFPTQVVKQGQEYRIELTLTEP